MDLKKNWQKSAASSNTLLRAEHFYISFNPTPVQSQGPETALVDARNLPNRPVYVLVGDHRLAYEELIDKGFDECFTYYLSHQQSK